MIRRLEAWGIRVATPPEPLFGGITNDNYRVGSDRGVFVARVCEELPWLGIDRRGEAACQEAAWRMGLAPELVGREPGLLVSRYIPGRPLAREDLWCDDRLARLARTLRSLHEGWDSVLGHLPYFCPFQAIRTYAATAIGLGARIPEGLPDMVADACRLSRRIAPFRPALCHNDLLPANLIEDGDRIWLIDWEYSGMGHPLFDLASVSANSGFAADRDAELLRAYRGEVLARELDELRLFAAASSLRESLWSLIQSVRSRIDFDYVAYSARNLESYRELRGRLED
ncbi:phosphotransferase [Aquisphaera insulae]|uniref:phosphotransferase n=1 Tax=Aquisphaera insulae TaxID=2712864 RepID=UPI0013EDA375|nr:phosphotransferase [Aquisphaera insulae]